jgi:hypothetical protein
VSPLALYLICFGAAALVFLCGVVCGVFLGGPASPGRVKPRPVAHRSRRPGPRTPVVRHDATAVQPAIEQVLP